MTASTADEPDGPLLALGLVNGVLALTALVLPLPVVLGRVVSGGGGSHSSSYPYRSAC